MSANRDSAVFDEPFRFNIGRSPNRHVAFGFGAHVCLGASLARMEIRLAFAELLARVEAFTPEGPIEWMPRNRLLGIRHMPLSIQFAGARCLLPDLPDQFPPLAHSVIVRHHLMETEPIKQLPRSRLSRPL